MSDTALTLPGEFTVHGVTDLRSQWLLALEGIRSGGGAGSVQLCADAVDEVDTAGLQLLVSLAHACRAAGASLRLDHPSPPLVAAVATLGLAAFLNIPTSEGADA